MLYWLCYTGTSCFLWGIINREFYVDFDPDCACISSWGGGWLISARPLLYRADKYCTLLATQGPSFTEAPATQGKLCILSRQSTGSSVILSTSFLFMKSLKNFFIKVKQSHMHFIDTYVRLLDIACEEYIWLRSCIPGCMLVVVCEDL